jgi:DNA-binding transcriptional MerR regulator
MKNETPLILVGQLSKLTHKTPRALRMYEDMGLLSPAERSANGYRRYNQKNIDQVKYIEQLQLMGLSLTEIQRCVQDWRIKVNTEDSGRDVMLILRELYVQKQFELQKKIEALQKINRQLQSATYFLQNCSTCNQPNVPQVCSSCQEQPPSNNQENFKKSNTQQETQQETQREIPELVCGMLSMIE